LLLIGAAILLIIDTDPAVEHKTEAEAVESVAPHHGLSSSPNS